MGKTCIYITFVYFPFVCLFSSCGLFLIGIWAAACSWRRREIPGGESIDALRYSTPDLFT